MATFHDLRGVREPSFREPFRDGSHHRMWIRHDPRIGHRYVENLRVRLPNELGGYTLRTNAQGFRSDLDFTPERTGRPRVLFFGDSYTAGDLCANDERFSDRVGEALDVEVYNYGVSGSGTDQQLLILEERAADVERDLIVLTVLAENIERNKVAQRVTVEGTTGRRVVTQKPRFTLSDDGDLRLENVPVPKDRPLADADADAELSRFGSHVRDKRLTLLYRAVDLYRSDRPWARRARHLLDPAVERLRPAVLRSSGFQPFPDYLDRGSEGWRLLEALLHRFVEKARCPVVVVPLPTYHNLQDEVAPAFLPRFAALEDPSRGLFVLDVTTPLCRLPRRERRRLQFDEDVHFSPRGHQQVAALLVEGLQKRALLPSPRPATREVRPPRRAERRTRGKHVLGISAWYHDSAAALVGEGRIVAAAEEERFSRVKNDRRFPWEAIQYCLEEGGLEPSDLAAVVFYDNASLTFERMLHTQIALGRWGERTWRRSMPSWVQTKLHVPRVIRDSLRFRGPILKETHHRSHAASAFYPSPFEEAAILTVDGVGEWASATVGVGEGKDVRLLREMSFPHSVGLLYSAFTQFTGFRVNSGEYKMMGLAPYGEPRYVDLIKEHLVHIHDDGSVRLNLEYFSFLEADRMTNGRFAALFGGPARARDGRITQRERDLARSVQEVTEEIVLKMARHAHALTGKRHLCLAGGVALNCVANGRLLREGPFDDIWIQPAAGDAGGALGAALDVHHNWLGEPRDLRSDGLAQGSSRFGPAYSDAEIGAYLESHGYPHERLAGEERAPRVARLLDEGKVVGHFDGRLEFGPRALGGRSILGDARDPQMQVTLNLKIKYRESFRPFAPSCLEERVGEYFEHEGPSPYMLLVAPVRQERRLEATPLGGADLTEIVRHPRSDVPAVTHVDFSARLQTVDAERGGSYYDVLKAFDEQTGCGLVVNTSFNVRGEPIVCTPWDAYRCFMRTEMDALVLGDRLLLKRDQPAWLEPIGPRDEGEERSGRGDVPPELERALMEVFHKRFLPVASRLKEADEDRVRPGRLERTSSWTVIREARGSPLRRFSHHPALLRGPVDARAIARAITADWRPGVAKRELRPIVEELVALGLAHPTAGGLEEAVGDAAYVMF